MAPTSRDQNSQNATAYISHGTTSAATYAPNAGSDGRGHANSRFAMRFSTRPMRGIPTGRRMASATSAAMAMLADATGGNPPAIGSIHAGAIITATTIPVASRTSCCRSTAPVALSGEMPSSVASAASPANCHTAPGMKRARFDRDQIRRADRNDTDARHHCRLARQASTMSANAPTTSADAATSAGQSIAASHDANVPACCLAVFTRNSTAPPISTICAPARTHRRLTTRPASRGANAWRQRYHSGDARGSDIFPACASSTS